MGFIKISIYYTNMTIKILSTNFLEAKYYVFKKINLYEHICWDILMIAKNIKYAKNFK